MKEDVYDVSERIRDEIEVARLNHRTLSREKVAEVVHNNKLKAQACAVRAAEHRAAGSPTSAFDYEIRRQSYLRQASFLEDGIPADVNAVEAVVAEAKEQQEAARHVLEDAISGGYPLPWEDHTTLSRCPRYNVGGRLVTGLINVGGGPGPFERWSATILDWTYGGASPTYSDRVFYSRDDAKAWVAAQFARYRDGLI